MEPEGNRNHSYSLLYFSFQFTSKEWTTKVMTLSLCEDELIKEL